MAQTSKSLYISLDYPEYRKNKANVLSTQIDLLNLMKHIQTFKKIKQEKNNLKMQLHAVFEKLAEDLKNINTKFPNPSIPKNIRDKLEPRKKLSPKMPEPEEQNIDKTIDNELLEIQEKLRRLNSS